MANTYTHRIVSLKKHNGAFLNLIKSFVIEITASNGSSQVSKEYTVKLNSPEPEDFTDYYQLTEAELISWFVSDALQRPMCYADIDKVLEESDYQNVESNFPWS